MRAHTQAHRRSAIWARSASAYSLQSRVKLHVARVQELVSNTEHASMHAHSTRHLLGPRSLHCGVRLTHWDRLTQTN